MKKGLIVFFLLSLSFSLYAQHRTEHEAIRIAQEFFAGKGKEPQLSVVPNQKVEAQIRKKVVAAQKAPIQNQSFYVVNDESNNRFVLVSADKRMYQVLGYSDNGTFDTNSAPLGLLNIMDEYNRQYVAFSSDESPIAYTEEQPMGEIPVLIETDWGQGNPFNIQCPVDEDGETCVTGCVATAMAQVMNYHRWPDHGSGGLVSYSAIPYVISIGQALNFDTLSINWQDIVTSYKTGTTEAQKDEVAKLMHACGVSVYMDYGSQSGAEDPNIPYALIHNFGYNPNIYYAAKKYYEESEWQQVVQEELKAGRPILYASDGGGGHQFILDGMKDGMYHFNFGWNGKDDGYFRLDALTPGRHNYTSNQSMIVGITPEEVGEHKDVFYTDEFKLDTIIDIGSQSKITSFEPFCFSSEANTMMGKARFRGEYGVGLFDEEFNFVKSLYKYSSNYFVSKASQTSWTGDGNYISFSSDLFTPKSSYYIAPYARGENSERVTLMRTLGGDDDWYRVDVKDGQVFLKRKMKFDGDSIKTDESQTVTLTLTCSEGGYLKYNDVTVTNETRTFQVMVGDTVQVEYGAFEGYTIEDGPVFGVPLNTQIGQNSHTCTIYGIKSNASVSITFAPIDSQPFKQISLTNDFQTFCSNKDLDFTNVKGLKVYIASGFNPDSCEVLLSHVNLVPAKTGMLLIGTAGQDYEVPYAETDFIYSNLFRGKLEDDEVTSGYVLDADRKEFVAVDGTVTVKGGEAYLDVVPVANAPRLKLRFAVTMDMSDAAGIDDILLDAAATSGAWYTLQGVRLNGKPGKPGIYVHQGRKVVVK